MELHTDSSAAYDDDVDWDEETIRQKCREGTAKAAQAYIECGYVVGPGIEPFDPVEALFCRSSGIKPTLRDVAKAVAKKHGLCYEQITSEARSAHLVTARREAYCICYTRLGASLPQIGRAFNRNTAGVRRLLLQENVQMRQQGNPGHLWVKGLQAT